MTVSCIRARPAQVEIDELTVVFGEAMHTGGGSRAADNAANYLLVAPGPNFTFDTSNCSGLVADDVGVAFSGVDYQPNTPAAPQATTILRLSAPLIDNHLRLLVCGSLEDAAGNALGGGDFSLDFRVDARNLFRNGHFDCDIEGWVQEPAGSGLVQQAPADADSSADSGSLQVLHAGEELLAIGQCLPIAPGVGLRVGGRFRVDAPPHEQIGLVRHL